MTHLRAFIVCGLIVSSAACSSQEEERSEEPSVALDGPYLRENPSAEGGGLAGVVFSGDRYRLRSATCADAGCEETGTFTYDRAHKRVDLVASGTGRTYSMSLEVVSTRATKSAVRPANLVDEPQQPLVDEYSVPLIVAGQVLLDGNSYKNDSDICAGQKILNATATHKTVTYWGNARDRKNVGDMACGKAKDNVDAACKNSPWVCTATPSGTTALPPDCEGTLEISCTCTATTKCNYSW